MKFATKLLLFSLFITVSCKNDTNTKDVEKVELVRYDQLLSNTQAIDKSTLSKWFTVDSSFTATYLYKVLGLAEGNSAEKLTEFKAYLEDQDAINAVERTFPNLRKIKDEFTVLNTQLKKQYPNYKTLNLRTCYTGFTLKNFLLEESIGVGLDMYLGSDFNYHNFGEAIPQYRIPTLQKDYLIPDIAESIYTDIYNDKAEFNTLLERMLYFGKQALFKNTLAPKSKPNVLLSMSEEDYDWCQENEPLIWEFFIERELLFSNEYQIIKTYINPGPFSSGMPEEAPANTGSYIGFKIMQAYQQKNKKLMLKELFLEEDAQVILNSSNYKP